MLAFRYKATSEHGKSISGTLDANDRRGALDLLAARGLYPSQLDRVAPAARRSSTALLASGNMLAPMANQPSVVESQLEKGPVSPQHDAPHTGTSSIAKTVAPSPVELSPGVVPGRVRSKEITAMTRQLSTLIGATIPIPTALAGMAEQEQNAALKAVITQVAREVQRGDSLSEALASYPKLFSTLYTSMVQVGEESGKLGEVLDDLADTLEDADEIRSEIASAVAYPAFVLGFGVVTTIILLTFVMPKLLKILDGMGDELPLPTLILLGASNLLQNHGLILLAATAFCGYAFVRWLASDTGAYIFDRARLRWPAVGGLFTSAALGRFCRTLGTLQKSGVSLLPSLEIVRNTVGNRYLSQRIAEVAEETKGGDSFAAPLRKLGIFPPTMVQMIAVGEETGRLAEMLLKVATIQDRAVRQHAGTLISLLGPVLILLVGAVVGFIVISLLMPIFNLSQGMS